VSNRSLRSESVSRSPAPIAALIAVALLAAGCSEGFDPFNRLTSLRVLAIRSEPAAPGPGETTTLDSYIYLTAGDSIASMSWSWCPFPGPANQGYPCLISEDELAALGGGSAGDVPPYDLGQGETATFQHTIDPGLLAAVCAGTADQPELLDCAGGFPVQIKLTVRSQSGEEVDSVRTLRLRFSDEHDPNQNPWAEGLLAVLDGGETDIGSEPTVTLPRSTETVVRAKVPADVIETYTGTDDNGAPEEKLEQIILTWFVESGDTKSMRTTFIDGIEPLEDAVENEWTPDGPEDYPGDTSQIVVVVRDDRDGVAWQTGVVSLRDRP